MDLAKPPKPTLLADQVYDVLHEAIVSGRLPAGSRLRIRDVAAQVGTSVMPVREAIRRLEEAGFAAREPHKGAVVTGVSLEGLVHIYAVRTILEREAARTGAANISAGDCDRMEVTLGLLRTAVDEGRLEDYLDFDEQLLTILYAAGGNPVLVSTIESLWEQCRTYKTMGIRSRYDSVNAADLWTYQQQLLVAARANDSDAAAAVSEASLRTAADEVRSRLAAERGDGGAEPSEASI